jgi:predicted lipase
VRETYDFVRETCRITLFVDIERTSFQGFTCVNLKDKEIYVVMRGTEDGRDVIIDALFFQVALLQDKKNRHIKVHAGFKKQLESRGAAGKLSAEVKRLLTVHPTFSVHVTGHSLAGALATLLGYRLSAEIPYKHIHVVPIASPRVGNMAFRKSCDEKKNLHIVRLVNASDIATALPMIGYHHVGTVLKLNASENVQVFENYSYDPRREFALWRNTSIAAHDVKAYWTNLRKVADNWDTDEV